jgi:hypothetical protein
MNRVFVNRVFVLYLVFVLVFTVLLVWLAGLWLGCCCSRIGFLRSLGLRDRSIDTT